MKVHTLEERPILLPDLYDVWRMFLELHNRRQIGFSFSPISLIDMKAWLDLNGYAGECAIRMYELVRQMDDWLIKTQQEEDKAKSEEIKDKGKKNATGR